MKRKLRNVLIKKKSRNWLLENFQKNRDFSMPFYSFNARARLGPGSGPVGPSALFPGPTGARDSWSGNVDKKKIEIFDKLKKIFFEKF